MAGGVGAAMAGDMLGICHWLTIGGGSGGEGADGEILVAATAATRTAASGVHWKATMAEGMSARAMIDGRGGDREEVGTRR